MTVLISRADDHLWCIVDEHLLPIVAVWFSSYTAAEDYCIDHNLTIANWELDD